MSAYREQAMEIIKNDFAADKELVVAAINEDYLKVAELLSSYNGSLPELLADLIL